jgi:hypothetical protein
MSNLNRNRTEGPIRETNYNLRHYQYLRVLCFNSIRFGAIHWNYTTGHHLITSPAGHIAHTIVEPTAPLPLTLFCDLNENGQQET